MNLHEGFAILARAAPLPQHILPDPEPARGAPGCTARGDCLFNGVPGKARVTQAAGGGRWAQACDYHTVGWARKLAGLVQAGDVLGLVTYLDSLPCACLWLIIAPQVTRGPMPHR